MYRIITLFLDGFFFFDNLFCFWWLVFVFVFVFFSFFFFFLFCFLAFVQAIFDEALISFDYNR